MWAMRRCKRHVVKPCDKIRRQLSHKKFNAPRSKHLNPANHQFSVHDDGDGDDNDKYNIDMKGSTIPTPFCEIIT